MHDDHGYVIQYTTDSGASRYIRYSQTISGVHTTRLSEAKFYKTERGAKRYVETYANSKLSIIPVTARVTASGNIAYILEGHVVG